MKNDPISRIARRMFGDDKATMSIPEEPAPFGSKPRKATPPLADSIASGIDAISSVTPRIEEINRQSESEGKAFLAHLGASAEAARQAGAGTGDMTFTHELLKRASRLISDYDERNDDKCHYLPMGEVISLNDRMIYEQGWRMGALDRQLMEHARRASASWDEWHRCSALSS